MDPEGSMTVIHSMEIGRPDRPPWHHYCFPVKWAEIGGVHAVGSTVMWGIMSQFLSRVCVRDGSNLFFLYIFFYTDASNLLVAQKKKGNVIHLLYSNVRFHWFQKRLLKLPKTKHVQVEITL